MDETRTISDFQGNDGNGTQKAAIELQERAHEEIPQPMRNHEKDDDNNDDDDDGDKDMSITSSSPSQTEVYQSLFADSSYPSSLSTVSLKQQKRQQQVPRGGLPQLTCSNNSRKSKASINGNCMSKEFGLTGENFPPLPPPLSQAQTMNHTGSKNLDESSENGSLLPDGGEHGQVQEGFCDSARMSFRETQNNILSGHGIMDPDLQPLRHAPNFLRDSHATPNLGHTPIYEGVDMKNLLPQKMDKLAVGNGRPKTVTRALMDASHKIAQSLLNEEGDIPASMSSCESATSCTVGTQTESQCIRVLEDEPFPDAQLQLWSIPMYNRNNSSESMGSPSSTASGWQSNSPGLVQNSFAQSVLQSPPSLSYPSVSEPNGGIQRWVSDCSVGILEPVFRNGISGNVASPVLMNVNNNQILCPYENDYLRGAAAAAANTSGLSYLMQYTAPFHARNEYLETELHRASPFLLEHQNGFSNGVSQPMMIQQQQDSRQSGATGVMDDSALERNAILSAMQLLESGFVSNVEPVLDIGGGGVSTSTFMNAPRSSSSFKAPRYKGQNKNQQLYHRSREAYSRHRIVFRGDESPLIWRGNPLPKDTSYPNYSEKIFVGGIHAHVTKVDLLNGFQKFGAMDVAWCSLGGEKVIQGCAYITLSSREHVTYLIQHCKPWNSNVKFWKGQRTWHYEMPLNRRTIEVEIILWDTCQGNCLVPPNVPEDSPNWFSIFVGNCHARFSARDLATFFVNRGFYDTTAVKLGCDRTEYPVGFAKVSFATRSSFIRAIRSRIFTIETPDFTRALQLEPFVEGSPCDVCEEKKAYSFCKHEHCYMYFCEKCYWYTHRSGNCNSKDNVSGHAYDNGADIVMREKRSKFQQIRECI